MFGKVGNQTAVSLRTFIKRHFFDTPSDAELDSTTGANANATVHDVMAVHGQASVVNGQVIVTDPEHYGAFATILIPDDERLYVSINGQKTTGRVVVSAAHAIKIEFINKRPTSKYITRVTDDKLSVYVQAELSNGVIGKLKDDGPIGDLVLEIEEIPMFADRMSPVDVLHRLRDEGYKGEVDYLALNIVCSAKQSEEQIVLRGTPPTPATRCQYKLVNLLTVIDEILRKVELSTIRTGETLAVYDPGLPSIPGRNVFGETVILDTETSNKLPRLGTGVIEVNGYIAAAIDGRLVLTKELIDVVPEHVIDSDVTVADGKIIFDGNIVIHGCVREGGYVKASGTIKVYESAADATIIGEKGVHVTGSITGCKVWAGQTQLVYTELATLIKIMIFRLERFRNDYMVMLEHAVKRHDAVTVIPEIPSLLLQYRHMELDQDLASFINVYSDSLSGIDSSYRTISDLIRTKWQAQRRNIYEEDIQCIIQKMTHYMDEIRTSHSEKSVIRCSSTMSSTLHATGNIIVKGTGSFSSTLESGHTISIRGNLRGGFAVAQKSAYIGEFGGIQNTESSVRVTNPDGFISIRVRHPNTLMEIAGQRDRCYEVEQDVHFIGGSQHC